jgi:hypothetical protein
MSRDAKVELDWADGTFTFRLGWGELAELQERCDAGPLIIHSRLATGAWRVEDISSVIRLGLIGGGMKPDDALKRVRSYVEARPPLENVPLAMAVLGVALQGAPDEPPGEAPGEATGEGSTTSPPESSGSA